MGRSHSDATKAAAVDLYCSGLSCAEVGRRLCIGENAVRNWARAAGVMRRPGRQPQLYPESDLALTNGSWRFDPFRRVQIWVKAIA